MILCGEARDIEAMREAQPKPGYRRLKDIIETRMSSLVKRVKAFLPEGEVVKATIMVSVGDPCIIDVLADHAWADEFLPSRGARRRPWYTSVHGSLSPYRHPDGGHQVGPSSEPRQVDS